MGSVSQVNPNYEQQLFPNSTGTAPAHLTGGAPAGTTPADQTRAKYDPAMDKVMGSHTTITDKSTAVDKSVSHLVDQVYGQNGQAKMGSGDAAWNLKQYITDHPEAKPEVTAALAQHYAKSYDAPAWQHAELGSVINQAGLGKDVGVALDALGAANPTAPHLTAARAMNGKQTSLSASQDLQVGDQAAKKGKFYDDLKTLNDPKAIATMEEFEYSSDQSTDRTNSRFGPNGVKMMSEASVDDPRWTSVTDKNKIIPREDRQKYIDAAKNVGAEENQPLVKEVTGDDGIFDPANGMFKSDLDRAIEKHDQPVQSKKLDYETVVQDGYLNKDEGKRWWANHEKDVNQALGPLNDPEVGKLADRLGHEFDATEKDGDGNFSMHALEKIATLTPDSPEWGPTGGPDQVAYDKRADVIKSAQFVTDPKNADVMKSVRGGDDTVDVGDIQKWRVDFQDRMKAQVEVSPEDQAKDPLLAINGDI